MSGMKSSPLPVWARLKVIKEITGAPDNWLYAFAASNPAATRKFGNGGTNGTLVFNVAKVCEAIENMEAQDRRYERKHSLDAEERKAQKLMDKQERRLLDAEERKAQKLIKAQDRRYERSIVKKFGGAK